MDVEKACKGKWKTRDRKRKEAGTIKRWIRKQMKGSQTNTP